MYACMYMYIHIYIYVCVCVCGGGGAVCQLTDSILIITLMPYRAMPAVVSSVLNTEKRLQTRSINSVTNEGVTYFNVHFTNS
jgi:hypothetical protein